MSSAKSKWSGRFKAAVEVTRGGIVESVHAAAIAVCDPGGEVIARLGDPDLTILLRSAAKPFQAAAVLASGAAERFHLVEPEVALIAGSHAGETAHVEVASSILAKAGVPPEALRCGIHVPFSRAVARRLSLSGKAPSPLMNNCSGKHAGMLAAARAGGHDQEGYLNPDHPVQVANRESVALFTGRPLPEIQIAVDGCSAPSFAVSLRETATAYALLASILGNGAGEGPLRAEVGTVIRAMRAHPAMVAGEGMLDTELMRAVPGLIAKVGADGIHTMGWSGPRGPLGIALKVMDGNVGRGRTSVVLAVLDALGALPDPSGLPESILAGQTVRNHRRLEVGEVRPIFRLESLPGRDFPS